LAADSKAVSLTCIFDSSIALRLGTETLAKNIKITPKELSDLIETLVKIRKDMP
jgi:hypothetical protein